VKKKFDLSSFKACAALRKQIAGCSARTYRELGRKIQIHHNTVNKYLTKIDGHCKAKKSAPKTTVIRHQSYVDATDAKLFLCKIVFWECRKLSIFQIDFLPVSFFHQIFPGYFFLGQTTPDNSSLAIFIPEH
jgi:hypothetical protein